jgi:hypothetical protein
MCSLQSVADLDPVLRIRINIPDPQHCMYKVFYQDLDPKITIKSMYATVRLQLLRFRFRNITYLKCLTVVRMFWRSW